jgi:hypothetical protein
MLNCNIRKYCAYLKQIYLLNEKKLKFLNLILGKIENNCDLINFNRPLAHIELFLK